MTSNTPDLHNEAIRIVDAYKTLQPDNKPEYFRYHRYRFVSLLETVMHLPGKRVRQRRSALSTRAVRYYSFFRGYRAPRTPTPRST
jgi:hypothetical protein